MELSNPRADVYVPDDDEIPDAVARTTHLGVGAHQDDLEIMAFAAIAECYEDDTEWFAGVTVSRGGRSPRTGRYAGLSDGEMAEIRRYEQRAAAQVGRYGAVFQLEHASDGLQADELEQAVDDIAAILAVARPRHVYTHSLADKHPTHVAVAAATLHAVRRLRGELNLESFAGCEVWRSLDWLPDDARIRLDSSGRDALAQALIGVFDSQVAAGKRYDLACLGRRRANATYSQPLNTDAVDQVTLAMDLMPLVDPGIDPIAYVTGYVDQLRADVAGLLATHFPARGEG